MEHEAVSEGSDLLDAKCEALPSCIVLVVFGSDSCLLLRVACRNIRVLLAEPLLWDSPLYLITHLPSREWAYIHETIIKTLFVIRSVPVC